MYYVLNVHGHQLHVLYMVIMIAILLSISVHMPITTLLEMVQDVIKMVIIGLLDVLMMLLIHQDIVLVQQKLKVH